MYRIVYGRMYCSRQEQARIERGAVVIHAEGLTKTFKIKKEKVEAVRGVDLDVAEGEVVALLGATRARK
jgi:ABC-2 type transport system ATP-binding protein